MRKARLIKKIQDIIDGCGYVIEDKDELHKDAIDLAILVRKDCKELLEELTA